MIVLTIQQTTSADDIFRCVFAGATIVTIVDNQILPNAALHMSHHC